MLTRILLAAIFAGVLSGVFVTAVQTLRVMPLILEAETYEIAPTDSSTHSHGEADGHDEADAGRSEAWAPDDGLERKLYTLMANILVGVSFSLILVAGILLTNSALTVRSGLFWGMGGFIAFVLAPNFGLSPELPGMDAAELGARQAWWIATVLATATALLIFAFRQQIYWMLAGLALLIAPHIYGAPHPATHESVVPANLAAEFVVATIVTSFLFWLVLGGTLGWLGQRINDGYLNE